MCSYSQMKYGILLVLWTILDAAYSAALPIHDKCRRNVTSPSRRRKNFLVVGHAGGDPVNYCENTIESTKSALSLGANAIEIDLSISKDGVIFLWHDPSPFNLISLARRFGFLLGNKRCYPKMSTNGASNRQNFLSIYSSWFHGELNSPSRTHSVVTLDKWLSKFASHPSLDIIWLDVKESSAEIPFFVSRLKSLLDRHSVDRSKIMFSTSSHEKGLLLQEHLFRHGEPSDRVTTDTVSWLPYIPQWVYYDAVDKGIAMCGCCANLGDPPIALNALSSLRSIVKYNVKKRETASKGAYVDVFVWTIDDESQMSWLIDAGVNGIITNRPGLLSSVLRKRGSL